MNQIVNSITVILASIVGVAILTVLVSKNSNTTIVIQSSASGFSSTLTAAMGSATGSSIGTVGALPTL